MAPVFTLIDTLGLIVSQLSFKMDDFPNWPQAPRVAAIRILGIEAPNRTILVGQTIKLRCRTNGDKLHSLSWSKNGQEFYRFQPFERRQQHLFFNLTGVTVDVSTIDSSIAGDLVGD